MSCYNDSQASHELIGVNRERVCVMSDKKRILVVDDEQDILKVVTMRLAASGYEVITAADGQEGLSKARSEKPDLIILDVMLPKLDGYKVCRMLKFDERYKKIPVIIFTARANESDIQLSKEVGAETYITKPFEFSDLQKKLQELLG